MSPCVLIPESKKDILILIDGSSNIAGQFPAVRDFVHRVISGLNVGPDGTRVAVAQYSDDSVKVEFNFHDLPSKQDILQNVKKMKIKTGRTINIGAALDYVKRNIFVRNAGSRIEEGVSQLMILLAAGRSSDDVQRSADELKRIGVISFVIKSRAADVAQLERIVYAPSFILATDSLSRIGDIQTNLVTLLQTDFSFTGIFQLYLFTSLPST